MPPAAKTPMINATDLEPGVGNEVDTERRSTTPQTDNRSEWTSDEPKLSNTPDDATNGTGSSNDETDCLKKQHVRRDSPDSNNVAVESPITGNSPTSTAIDWTKKSSKKKQKRNASEEKKSEGKKSEGKKSAGKKSEGKKSEGKKSEGKRKAKAVVADDTSGMTSPPRPPGRKSSSKTPTSPEKVSKTGSTNRASPQRSSPSKRSSPRKSNKSRTPKKETRLEPIDANGFLMHSNAGLQPAIPVLWEHEPQPDGELAPLVPAFRVSPRKSPGKNRATIPLDQLATYGSVDDDVVMVLPPLPFSTTGGGAPEENAGTDYKFNARKELTKVFAPRRHAQDDSLAPQLVAAADTMTPTRFQRHQRVSSLNDSRLVLSAPAKYRMHTRSKSSVDDYSTPSRRDPRRFPRSVSFSEEHDGDAMQQANQSLSSTNHNRRYMLKSPRNNVTFSPGTPLITREDTMSSFDPGMTEMFLPESVSQMTASASGSNAKSSRRSHMRHKSVELFMRKERGEEQPRRCRDVLFALLFCVQLAVVSWVALTFGANAFAIDPWNEHNFRTVKVSYLNILQVACFCGIFACVLSGLALFFMTIFARKLIQIALVFSIGLSFVWGTIGIGFYAKSFVPITGVIALLLSVGYAFVVWDRIRFAAANVHTALSGVKGNLGTTFIAYFFQVLTLGWSLWWFFAAVGIYDWIQDQEDFDKTYSSLIYVGLGISYYWTFQTILHIVHVAVSRPISSWWTDPNHNSRQIVWKSFLNSILFSFGSICFGSLFVGFIQITRQIAESFRPQRSDNVLLCFQECLLCVEECILAFVDNLVISFNPWAFTYVGLYGYGFRDAGRKATKMFEKRGWTKISTDDLVNNVLLIFSLVIGGCTGFFGYMVEAIDGYGFTSLHDPATTAFLIGFVIGLVLSYVLMSIVTGSVNAVIVCFAGCPQEFEKSHPELSHEMCTAWKEVWPGCMDLVNVRALPQSTVLDVV